MPEAQSLSGKRCAYNNTEFYQACMQEGKWINVADSPLE